MRPYKGLESFADTELDALLFFGRTRERETVVANAFANRLTIVYGASGVGKSSLLRAGVARRLRADETVGAVVVHDAWADRPVEALIDSVRAEVPEVGAAAGLVDTVAAAAQARGETYLLLDQLEELFVHQRGGGPFVDELPELLRRPGLRANVVVALRDDALAELDAFTTRIPGVFANLLRLERLDRGATRDAIEGPLRAFGGLTGGEYRAEPALVDSLLDESLEAPFLQLVLDRLWAEERLNGAGTLRLGTLERLGGADAIVRGHVDGALDRLDGDDRAAVVRLVRQLVTPSGAKVSHTEADLAGYVRREPASLRPLLETLTRERVVRAVDRLGDGGPRYEIFHDVLAEPLLRWRQAEEVARERAAARTQRRRLLAVIAATAATLLVVAAVAAFALAQRSDARSQARRSHAHELAADALADLPANPAGSLALALRAARLSPDAQAVTVLRSALLALRERAVLALGGRIVAASFASRGDELLAASSAGVAGLYRADGRRMLALPRAGPLTRAAWSADGALVATGAGDGAATIWDAADGRRLRVVRTRAPIAALSFVRHVLLVGSGGHLLLVHGTHGTERGVRLDGAVVAAAPAPDLRTVAVAVRSAGRVRVELVDMRTRRVRARLPERGVEALAFSPDGRLLATGSTDRTARLWRGGDARLVHVLPQRGYVVAVRFSPDGRELLTSSADGTAAVWDVRTGTRRLLLVGATGAALDAAVSPDGREYAVAFADRDARLYDSVDGRLLAPLAGHRDAVTSVSFDASGRLLATGGDDGTVRVWSARASDELAPDEAPGAGSAVAAPGPPQVRRVGALARARAQHVAVSHGVVATTDARTAFLWDARSGALLHTLAGHRGLITDAAFSPDGTELVTASVDHDARIWDVASGRLLHVLRGHFFPVYSAAFSPDGAWVVTASQFTAGLWDAATGQLVEYLRGPTRPLARAAFSADGTRILAVDRAGRVRVASCEICLGLPGLEREAERRLAALRVKPS